MATTAAPFGMRPVQSLAARYNTQGFNTYNIASGYATDIFTGDVVQLVTAGTIEKDIGTITATPIGIFLGCEYTTPDLNYRVWSQRWPANTVDANARALVVDDPDAVFQIQADGAVDQTALGANAAIVQNAGSVPFGLSRNALDASSVATTATLPLRIVDFYRGPESTVGDAFTDLLVKWNAGHQLNNPVGV